MMRYWMSEGVGTVMELSPWALRKRVRGMVYGRGVHAAGGADSLWAGVGAVILVASGAAVAVGALLAAGV